LPVVTIAQINLLRLRIPVPESLASKVRIGDPADVHVQATGEHFTGKVARFTDSLDTSTRTMQVEIDVPNPTYHLQPGMYADVVLAAGRQPNVLTVPINAIQHGQNTTTVLAVDAQNRVRQRQVNTGVEDSNKVEIVSGLSEGDRVIIGNLGSHRDGQLVQPKESVQMGAGTETE
jgi:RND family efflux transporter MFP subunit